MGRGRPRKAGKRTKSGRLKRDNYAVPSFDKGTERTQWMKAAYGEHYSSPIGRLYAKGMLGEEEIARVRYDVGKKFARLCARLFERPYRCALDTTPRMRVVGGAAIPESCIDLDAIERDKADQDWLFTAANKLDGAGLRPWLDQIIGAQYTDSGPYWADALLSGGKHPADKAVLKCAIDALDLISADARPQRILVSIAP